MREDKEAKNVELDREIRARAMRDDPFREALLRDPKGTLEREYGATIPDEMSIQVHEETDESIHFVIPGRVSGPSAPSDKNLGDTAGAMRSSGTGCCTCGSRTHQTFVMQGAPGKGNESR